MLDPEKDSMLLLVRTVLSVLMKSVHNASQNGNAKVLFRFRKIIGKYILAKGFLLKDGLGQHGFLPNKK